MSDVESGEILIADYQGIYVIKMSGDVRLNLCIAFDDCIESLFAREDFQSVFFDLSCAENLDSTTLGLIAKVAIKCQTKSLPQPMVHCKNSGIIRLLTTMGIDEICRLVDQNPVAYEESNDFQRLKAASNPDEDQVKAKVLESHHILMALNESNRQTFKDLVQTLKCV